MPRHAPTDDELARVQQAVSEAADDWIQENEGAVPFEPPAEGLPTDYGQHHPVVSQTIEQRHEYFERLDAAAAAAWPA